MLLPGGQTQPQWVEGGCTAPNRPLGSSSRWREAEGGCALLLLGRWGAAAGAAEQRCTAAPSLCPALHRREQHKVCFKGTRSHLQSHMQKEQGGAARCRVMKPSVQRRGEGCQRAAARGGGGGGNSSQSAEDGIE